jgi:molybdate transport system permease protein
MVVSVPTAYALARWRFRGRILVDALLDIPIVLSPIVIGIALILVFRSGPGQWIEDHAIRFVFEVPGIVIAQFVLSLAMQVRVLKAGFEEMNPRYEQVARFLGCTPFGAFWRVTLPMCRSSLIAAFVLGWSRAIGDFGATVTIAGSVRNKTETIPVAIYNNLASVKIGKALGLAILLTTIALVVLVVIRVFGARRER